MLKKFVVYICIIVISAPISFGSQEKAPKDGEPLHIPEGTALQLSLRDPVSSKLSEVGDEVSATLTRDLYVDGIKILSRYTEFVGRVTYVQPAKRPMKSGRLHLTFDKVRLDDREHKLVAVIKSASDFTSDEKIKGDSEGTLKGGSNSGKVLENIRTGASLGGLGATIIILASDTTIRDTASGSTISRGGVGPAIAMIGGGAVAGILLTKGKEVRLPAGSIVRITLEKPLSVEN